MIILTNNIISFCHVNALKHGKTLHQTLVFDHQTLVLYLC